MKVWVAFEGDYSERQVVGVYTREDLAERAREYGGEIREWETDKKIADLPLWWVRMTRKGESYVMPCSHFAEAKAAELYSYKDFEQGPMTVLICKVRAEDEKHAVKIANEKRVQLIANGEWDKAGWK